MSRGPDKQFNPEVALERAMELFWAKGYAATGLAELLDTMGIARKSLYDTFGNKRDLFIKALELYSQKELGKTAAALRREGSPLGNVRRVLRLWQKGHSTKDSKGCMLGINTAHFDVDDEEMAKLLRGYYLGLERAFVDALARARGAGELAPGAKIEDLAQLLIAAGQGMALISRTRDDGTLARGVVRAALAALDAAA